MNNHGFIYSTTATEYISQNLLYEAGY